MNFQWSDFGTSNGTKFSHEFTTDQKLVPAQHSIAQHHNFQWHCLDNFKMSYTLPPLLGADEKQFDAAGFCRVGKC